MIPVKSFFYNNNSFRQTKNYPVMKKIVITTLFFCFLFGQSISAQTDFRFGFQVSPTFSWMRTNDNAIRSNGTNLGVKIGMLGELFFAENYALVSGIGLAFNQGGTLKHDQGGNFWANSDLSDQQYFTLPNDINLKYSIQYVEIPLSLRMRTREFGYLRYFAEIPVFTFGLETQSRGATKGFPGGDTEKENINQDVNFLALSWGFGGGVEYSLSSTSSLMGGIFYQNGFLDVTRDKNARKFDTLPDGTPDENSAEDEDSNGLIGAITLRIALMF
jgi:hypothetical protein